MDPNGKIPDRGGGPDLRHPDVLHPPAHAMAQGSLRGGRAQAAGHVGAGPRGRADAQIQGQPDRYRPRPLQRREPRVAVGGVQLWRDGSRPLRRQPHDRLEGDARGAPVRQSALRRGYDAGSVLLGRCFGQPLPRLRYRRLDSRCHLGLPDDRIHEPDRLQEHLRRDGARGARRQARELRGAHRFPRVEVHEESAGGQGILDGIGGRRQGGHGRQHRLQHAVPQRYGQEAHAGHRIGSEAAGSPGFPEDRGLLRLPRSVHAADPGSGEPLRIPGHFHAGGAGRVDRRLPELGGRRIPSDLRQAQARMTSSLPSGGPDAASARAAAVSLGVRPRTRGWFSRPSSRRLAFGYMLLAPAALYVLLLVGVPFLFSLYLAVSDANVGEPVSRFVGLENFRAAWEMDTFWIALRNSVVFLVVAAIFKSLLGTSLAFLLLQNFKGKKLVRGLVVIPFTLPIAISVLSWKWMYDSQFSVINWVLSRLGLIGQFGTEGWPIWLGNPKLALIACILVNVWRTFPFSAIVLLAGFTSVPVED